MTGMFIVAFAAVLVVGAVSVFWVMRGVRSISDELIRKLFNYVLALTMALIALSVVFLTWVTLSIELNPPEMSENNPMAYLFIIAILALVFGSALSIKRISDTYGFKFRGQGQVKKTQQKAQIKAKPKKGKR